MCRTVNNHIELSCGSEATNIHVPICFPNQIFSIFSPIVDHGYHVRKNNINGWTPPIVTAGFCAALRENKSILIRRCVNVADNALEMRHEQANTDTEVKLIAATLPIILRQGYVS